MEQTWRTTLAREKRSPAGFIEPCAAVLASTPPAGPDWVHEVKYDGYRIIARVDAAGVRLWSRNGLNWSARLPTIVQGLRALGRHLVLDGEAVCFTGHGVPDFHGLSSARGCREAALVAFDLLALDGVDLRERPLLERRELLADLLSDAPAGVEFSEGFSGDGETLFRHICGLGLEGIVSKRLASKYRSGRSPHWRKTKNANYVRVRKESGLAREALDD